MNDIGGKIFRTFVEGKVFFKALSIFDNFIGSIVRSLLFSKSKINPKKIIFLTFQGDYTCNPKYICEQLLNENIDCEIIWVAGIESYVTRTEQYPNNISLVRNTTYEFYKEYANARIIILNSVDSIDLHFPKKKGQTVIQTWHGSLGIKRFGVEANKNKKWLRFGIKSGKNTDYCISNSNFEDNVFRTSFWAKSKILKYGHPRNDIFFNLTENKITNLRKKILSRYNVDINSKIILYAPTFRNNIFFNYEINYDLLLEAIIKRFGSGNWIILKRFHENLRSVKFKNNPLNIVEVSEYPDIQEILCITDVAVTDYSSWIFDYILMEKPGFIYATDIKNYNNERGFYFPLESTPFPIATNNDELYTNIINFDEELYHKKRKDFLEEKGCMEDGKASERVVLKIKEIINQ